MPVRVPELVEVAVELGLAPTVKEAVGVGVLDPVCVPVDVLEDVMDAVLDLDSV